VTSVPQPFRFGLIGAGVAAEIHAAAMRRVPGVEVHAVADAVSERARVLAIRHGIPEVHESGEALAARAPVDAVAVLTPHHLHLPYVLAAARAGRHVLVEKAIAHTVAAADEMIEACRAHGVTLAGIFQNRFTPAARELRDAVSEGVLGRVFFASVTVKEHRSADYFRASPWRGRKAEAGGGVLMIQAIHMIDLLLWVLGMPRRVVAHTRTAVHDVEVEDVAVGLLEFEGGVTAVLQATTGAMPEQPPSVEIHGDRGTATVSGSWGHLAFRLRTAVEPVGDIVPEPRPPEPAVEPYAAQIADFVAAVRERRAPLVDGGEARKALVVVDALYRSASKGEWVTIDPASSAQGLGKGTPEPPATPGRAHGMTASGGDQ
jgi:predicted dehydrogenase